MASGRATTMLGLLLGFVGPAWAQSSERAVLGRVALTTDATLVRGCTLLGRVKDDDVKDLRRKVVRLGGDTAIVAFGYDDIHADVYRCPVAPPQAPPAIPADIPPPPAGTPPPPPPDTDQSPSPRR